ALEWRASTGDLEPTHPPARVRAPRPDAAPSPSPPFPPITADELAQVDIEISLLGLLERIHGPDEIEVGRHGLVVEQGWQRGLLLPQVATEWHWDADAFLAHTCQKAGLPRDAWKHGAAIFRFEPEVFGQQ